LLKDVPGSLYMGLPLIGSEPWKRGWQNLEHSLVTGEVAFDQVMGDPFFDYLDKHPEYGTPYHQWMTVLTMMAARAITESYDFAPVNSVCDVGGGQGILLKSILTANPHLRGPFGSTGAGRFGLTNGGGSDWRCASSAIRTNAVCNWPFRSVRVSQRNNSPRAKSGSGGW